MFTPQEVETDLRLTGGKPVLYGHRPFTVDGATDRVLTAGHGFPAGLRLEFVGGAPGGLATGTGYYVLAPNPQGFQVAATAGGAAVDLVGAAPAGSQVALSTWGHWDVDRQEDTFEGERAVHGEPAGLVRVATGMVSRVHLRARAALFFNGVRYVILAATPVGDGEETEIVVGKGS